MTVNKILVEMLELTCERCGHVWKIPIGRQLPKICYKCKSVAWNRELKRKREK